MHSMVNSMVNSMVGVMGGCDVHATAGAIAMFRTWRSTNGGRTHRLPAHFMKGMRTKIRLTIEVVETTCLYTT